MDAVLVIFKGKQRREFNLQPGETIVGRRQDCGLRVQTADVSRQHCAITVGENSLSVKDLGSANGTQINGELITEAELHAGDCLKVGPALFVVQIDGEPAEITPEDTRMDLVDLDAAESPTTVAAKDASNDDDDDDADDEVTLTEDDLFEISDDELDLSDPLSAVEDLLDAEDDEDEDLV